MKKIAAIIGGGPVGLYCASLLSSKKFEVHVFEEHPTIGRPVQCTGIVTGDIMDISSISSIIDDSTLNKINEAHIFSYEGEYADFSFRRENIILDRCRFDGGLANLAKGNGAQLHFNHSLIDIRDDLLHFKEKGSFRFDICIGSDGPLSKVRSLAGLKGKERFWFGAQARARCPQVKTIEFYPFIDGYGWVVPEGKGIVRLGIAVRRMNHERFRGFLKDRLGTFKALEYQGGIIPEYDPYLKIRKGNFYLLGDAATQVKATTGGGIIPGLRAAEALSSALNGRGDYLSNLKDVRRSLWLHLKIRNALDGFKKKDYKLLIEYFKNPEVRKIMGEHDRENPMSYLFKIILKEPRLLRFFGKLI